MEGWIMPQQRHEIMVLVQNPPEFVSWPRAEKLGFYENVVSWHKYIAELMRSGEVTRAWGAEKIPGRVRANATKTVLIAIYNATFSRFTELISRDPLWDTALYEGPILKSIEGDYDDDLARFRREREYLQKKLGRRLAAEVVTFQGPRPEVRPGGDLEVLVISKNTPGYHDLSDEAKLAETEKVLQMHDYHQPLREAGIITDEWGTYQNCGFGVWSGAVSASGIWLTRVNSYDEFDIVFQTNPVRDSSLVRTVVLVPFEESRRRAEEELQAARNRP
jgi:hypothetical protein